MRLVRGETLRLAAPPGAVEMRLIGQGANLAAEVADGQGVLTPEQTTPLAPGAYAVGWRVVAPNGDVSLPDGPRLTVADPLSEQFEVPETEDEKLLAAGRKVLADAAATAQP